MSTRLLRRRAVTALGTYGGVVLGVLATLVAARQLGPHEFGLYALVLATTGFFQVLLDLTVEEAMVKFGFRYTAAGQYGRLRRLYRRALGLKCLGALIAGAVLAILAPFADSIFGADGLTQPMLIAALLPIAQVPEALAGAAIVLTGRYDVRGAFLFLTPAFRLAGIAIGAHYGVEEAVLGLLLGQIAGSLAVSGAGLAVFRRFPAAAHEPLRGDRSEILRFVIQSSIATGIVSLRTTIAPLLLGVVTNPVQVGYFRVAQAPQTGLSALTSPARLILLTEQTRDWEAGSTDAVFASVRRFTLGGLVLMAVLIPPLFVFMPDLIRIFYGVSYLPAADAARIMLIAGAIQLVIAWTKSLPVSIGRPGLRIVTHGIETLVLIPLVLVFGFAWEVTGAAAAVLVSTAVFAVVWGVALTRIQRETRAGRPTRTEPVTP
jgi:O-antigen/teichoic acid export membrane protein